MAITQPSEANPEKSMKLRVTTGYFKDKREATQEISDSGWWPVSWRDAPGEVYEPHKHDADQTLYLVEGSLELHVDDKSYRLNPGDKLELPAFTVHSVKAPPGATYIIGMPKVDLLSEHSLAPDA
jgi:mannose-6-phosphate isomerase-like protein (cupin superfamily)